MTLPTFLVVGAGRSGTTSLHHHLRAHPDVFVPAVKAPSYFYCADGVEVREPHRRRWADAHFVCERDDYERLFADRRTERAVGEVSPAYLAAARVPERIAGTLPEVRVVAVLRDPIDRLVARYVARRRDGLERRGLDEIVAAERADAADLADTGGTYLAAGFVSPVLARYLDLLGPERVLLLDHDELRTDTTATLRKVFAFIGVDPGVEVVANVQHNRSGGTIANPIVRTVWTRSVAVRERVRPFVPRAVRDRAFALATRRLVPTELDPALRAELVALYRPEVDRLAVLSGRDLATWTVMADRLR